MEAPAVRLKPDTTNQERDERRTTIVEPRTTSDRRYGASA